MTLEIKTRIAGPEDAALLAETGRAAFSGAFADQNEQANMEVYLRAAFSASKQAEELADPNSVFFIAETAEKDAKAVEVVGYARLLAGPAPTCITGQNAVELVRFYLLPRWIGSGAANGLMRSVLEYARGRGWETVWLGVWQQNPRAVRFYQRWGFTIADEHIFQLGADAQHDWIMVRDLQKGSV